MIRSLGRSLASSVRSLLWLVRGGGLRQQMAQMQQELDCARRRLDALNHLLCRRTQVRGHVMLLNPLDQGVSKPLLEDGCFEPYETYLVEREVGPGDVVVDIGANIGYFTLLLARQVGPTGKVYAFEPDPTNFDLLRKNVRGNGYHNVVLVPRAVAEASGKTCLYQCHDNAGDHRLYDTGEKRLSIEIETTSLDDFFAHRLQTINFIKMDIQGYEGHALAGMRRVLEANPRVKMITEFWPFGLKGAGGEPRDYLERLRECGFSLFRIDDEAENVEPADSGALLREYTPESARFTNLFCLR